MSLLKCEKLTVGYEDGIVISDVSFELNKGDYVCVLGENGAGKSSLLKGIFGLATVKSGKIIYGDDCSRKDIGYLAQQKEHQKNFPALVEEVVLSGFTAGMGLRPFYTKAEKARAGKLIEEFGMGDYRKASFSTLSGGQKQRVLLARALCSTEKLLFLDEPATGLDPTAAEEMYELFKKLNKEHGTTIFMVSHDTARALSDSNKILHIGGKGASFFGTTKEYLASDVAKKFLGN